MKQSKYLVRPDDFHIFEIDNSNGCYRSYTLRNMTYPDGSRIEASDNFTFDTLTTYYNFFPIDEDKLSIYEYFAEIYSDFIKWQCRSDGHGGTQGGTFDEYKNRLKS